MLSKSKMQILRIGAVIHVLFHYDKPHDVPSIISCDAIKSSVKFVDTCIQHVLFVLGRKDIKDEIDEIQQKLQSKHDINSTDTLLSTCKTRNICIQDIKCLLFGCILVVVFIAEARNAITIFSRV